MKKFVTAFLLFAVVFTVGCGILPKEGINSKSSEPLPSLASSAELSSLPPSPSVPYSSSTQKAGSVSTAASGQSSRNSAESSTDSSSKSSDQNIKAKAKNTNRIPILMYHSILTEKNNAARLPPESFQSQMKWLHDNGYKTLTLDEFYADYAAKKGFPQNFVVLTFDDGYFDNFTNAYPVLKKYGFHATIFMISGDIGKPGYLTADQIKQMSASGTVDIECHTLSHPNLDGLPYQNQLAELSQSKTALEKLTGRPVNYIAYPSGKYNEDTLKAARSTGYRLAFKMSGGPAANSESRLELPRVFIGDDMQKFIQKVKMQ